MNPKGGCVVAMKGKNCIAIASDLGFYGERYITGINTPKVFKIHDTLCIGLSGLLGDISSIKQILEYEISNFLLKENTYPDHFEITNILSHLLYKNRFTPFFTEPILVGIDKNGNPIINSMDIIGAISSSNKFSVSGVGSEGLYGMCESLWKPEMSKAELFRTICKCISFTTNRDCLTGMGSSIHIISKGKIESKRVELRLD
jgi:20S proteasome subunit beta 3|mmetsp:Transcript_19819/g.29129  ORF Transcript_19819/g.29129 Transcript_19819/m.29129 type:complete len:202 (+) Transcript_19819:232-837(+)